jgi:hypothetical protein
VKISSTRSSFQDVVFSARPAFSKRSWPYVVAVVVPWLLLAGQRCMTRLAAISPRRRSLSGYYRFLSGGKWRLPVLFRSLFRLLVGTFPSSSLTLVVDDTLVPKVGRGIFGTGYHFDHVKRQRPGVIWGHDWLVLALVVQVGSMAWIALPFWVSLYRAKKSCAPSEFRTRTQLALEALREVRTWFSGPIHLLADGAYNHNGLVAPLDELRIFLISRLRYDARLNDLTPLPRRGGRPGRNPRHGARFTPEDRLSSPEFVPITVEIYGKQVTLLAYEFLAWWVTAKRVIKVVITKDPKNARRFAYLSSTNLGLSAVQVVEHFSRRWSIEQLFSVCKNQLGFDSAEVRTPNSVTRHAALTIALASWVEVWTYRANPHAAASSFATKLGRLREDTVASLVFATGPRTRRNDRIARSMAGLFSTVTRAA